MYTDYFNLREEPFQVTPNPRFLFLSNIHNEAIQRLVDGIRRRKGFIELVGMAGTGKTLLCKELVQMLASEMDIAYIFYPVLSEQALYFSILKQWGVVLDENTPVPALLERISAFLRGRFARGRNALIILDEAQNLSLPLLENLRLLSNLETDSEKLLQILLSGQPEFHALLKSGKIPQLDQRIRVRVFLKALDRQTLPLYVYHRLNMAGAGNVVSFTDEAFDLIYKTSGGIPRLINAVCERSLEEAALRKTGEIDRAIVRAALEELEGEEGITRRLGMTGQRGVGRGIASAVGVLILVALAGGAAWYARRPVPPSPEKTETKTVARAVVPKSVEPSPTRGGPAARQAAGRMLPRLRPLAAMRAFLDGMLPVPENKRLYWGRLRLSRRDIAGFVTPFLLHVARSDGTAGWLCARKARSGGLQFWHRGDWAPMEEAALASWTGRCGVPYWIAPLPDGERALRKGMKGAAVADLQGWLVTLGDLAKITGIYDGETEAAVRRFQLRRGLTPDGVAGAQTLALLFQWGHPGN